MRIQRFLIASVFVACQTVFADEILYRYEADAFPAVSEGWVTALGETCTQSLAGGFLINTWPDGQGSFGSYQKVFGDSSNSPPPPPFWVEWRFASNNAIHGSFLNDGVMFLGYNFSHFVLNMYGDSIIWEEGGTYVLHLTLNEFRTYRFESIDGNEWCAWYDGKLFLCGTDGQSGSPPSYVIMAGSGASPYSAINRWDYVRYGRLTTGETILAADPPVGYLDPTTYSNLDRFTVTFDQPNYVYVADITVDVRPNQNRDREGAVWAAGDVPTVIATRRQDNGPPETFEIVLDRPLAVGSTTRFTFNTGAATPQTIEYTVAVDPHPMIPTLSSWGLIIFTLLLFIAAKILQVAHGASGPSSALSKVGQ